MTSRIAVVAVDALNPRRVADFWAAVLDWTVLEESAGGVTIGPADRSGPVIDVLPVPAAKAEKNRLHFDLRADGSTAEAEVERLISLGARRVDVGQPVDATWTVLADPEGNEFCVLGRSTSDVTADG